MTTQFIFTMQNEKKTKHNKNCIPSILKMRGHSLSPKKIPTNFLYRSNISVMSI